MIPALVDKDRTAKDKNGTGQSSFTIYTFTPFAAKTLAASFAKRSDFILESKDMATLS